MAIKKSKGKSKGKDVKASKKDKKVTKKVKEAKVSKKMKDVKVSKKDKKSKARAKVQNTAVAKSILSIQGLAFVSGDIQDQKGGISVNGVLIPRNLVKAAYGNTIVYQASVEVGPVKAIKEGKNGLIITLEDGTPVLIQDPSVSSIRVQTQDTPDEDESDDEVKVEDDDEESDEDEEESDDEDEEDDDEEESDEDEEDDSDDEEDDDEESDDEDEESDDDDEEESDDDEEDEIEF